MKTIIIAAVAENGAIGKDNNLIWRLPNDMKFFKDQTNGHTVVTGRKNYESIPEKFRPLPNRINIVITRNSDYKADGANVVTTVQDAMTVAKIMGGGDVDENRCYIIGGGEIYNQTIGVADEMYITKVKGSFDADTFFPAINESLWNIETIQSQEVDEKHAHSFEILHYTKK